MLPDFACSVKTTIRYRDDIEVLDSKAQFFVSNIYGRGLRLDILAKGKDGVAFHFEVERSKERAIPKRARFTGGLVDSRLLKRGQDEEGKRVFLSVDSRAIPENPLYRAFRAKSFTDTDIMLHFQLLDLLRVSDGLSITGVMDELSDRLSEFEDDELPDESTVRKKLREYAGLGLVCAEKRGRETFYVYSEDWTDLSTWDAAAAFFSEASPLGVIGTFVQDRIPERFQQFRFKHHYILNALDSEVLCEVFLAIRDHRMISFIAHEQHVTAIPLKVYIGTQTGRQYLLAWSPENERCFFHRADLMNQVKAGDPFELSDELKERVEEFCMPVYTQRGADAVKGSGHRHDCL